MYLVELYRREIFRSILLLLFLLFIKVKGGYVAKLR